MPGFFREWSDSGEARKWLVLALLAMALVVMGVHINYPAEQPRTSVYLSLIFLSFLFILFNYYSERFELAGFAGLGDSRLRLLVAAAVGGGLFFIALRPLALSVPLSGVSAGLFGFLYVVIASPFVEEIFFRGMLQHVLIRLRPADNLLMVVGSNLVFALYHFTVYNASVFAILTAFVLGMVFSFGNNVFKSLGFSIGAHAVNNVMAFFR